MTSAGIRAALSNTLALAPAIAKAAEIVAAAEQADVMLAEMQRKKDAIQADIDGMESAANSARADLSNVNDELASAKQAAAEEKAALNQMIADLIAKQKQVQTDCDEAQVMAQGILADLESQKVAKQQELDALKDEIGSLLDRFGRQPPA